jgi:ketosteroid isomerase-like protein
MRTVIPLVLTLTLSLPAVADESADRAALEAAAQSWAQAFNARDSATMASLSTNDVVLLEPDAAPVVGHANARKAWEESGFRGATRLAIVNKETVILGDHAWRIDALALRNPDGAPVRHGQSLGIWKRVEGEWRLHRYMTGDLATPAIRPKPAPSEPVLDKPVN